MSELRQKFESLPEVDEMLKKEGASFGLFYTDEIYLLFGNPYDYLNGAWYAFQEQQAKIDLLEKELTETQAFLNKQNHIKQTKIDELQARIDEALRFYNEAKSPHNIGMIQMATYLKGNKDEN